MNKEMWRGIVAVVIMVTALAGFSCSRNAAEKKAKAKEPPEHKQMLNEYMKGVEESKSVVVARVNGIDITKRDLIGRMNQIAQRYVGGGQELTPDMDQKIKKDALDVLVFRELAVQEAVRQGMKVRPEIIDQAIANLIAKMGSEEEFRKNLKMTGNTEASLRRQIEKDHLFNMVADREIFQKAKGTGDKEQAIEKRKREWEAGLKKNAKIEIDLSVEVKGQPLSSSKK